MLLVVMNEPVLLKSQWQWIRSSWKSTTEEDMVPGGRKCKSSISDFCTVNKDVEELAVGQCEPSDPRVGVGGKVKTQNQVLTCDKV